MSVAGTQAHANARAHDAAQRLVQGQATLDQALAAHDPLPLAWALKDACYSAWSSQPQQSVAAAEALQALATNSQKLPAAVQAEIQALVAWTTAIAHITRGQMAPAVAALDSAEQGFRQLARPAIAAQTQVPKVMALAMLGQHDAAVACAVAAQQELRALGEPLAAAKVSLNLAALRMRRGEFMPAAQHAREAAVLFARAGDTEHSVMADITLADSLTSLGDLDEADRIYARAGMRAGHHGLPVLQALVHESTALLDLVRGRWRHALAGFENSRRSYEALAMPQHLAIAEKQLADAYLELRLLPEALALYERAVARLKGLAMPDDLAWALAQQGRTLALLGQPVPAAGSLQRAAAIFAEQSSASGSAAIALARAELALHQGSAAAAAVLAAAAAMAYAACNIPQAQWQCQVVHAQALLASGDAANAKALFTTTLEHAQALALLPLQWQCYAGLGQAALAEGEPAAAAAPFKRAIELFEVQRRALPDDDMRSTFLADHLLPYQGMLRLALLAHADGATASTSEAVLQTLEHYRARVLGQRLAQGAALAPRQEGPAVRALRERLSWLYRRINKMRDEGDDIGALSAQARGKEYELLEIARRERLVGPSDGSVDAPAAQTDFDSATLVGRLQPGQALVEYGVVDDELLACVVTCSGVHVQRHLARWSEVLAALQAASFQLDTLRHGAAPVQQHMHLLGQRMQRCLVRLHALVWAPLAKALAEATQLLVVPHAQLGALPFAALNDGGQALGLSHHLALAPSAQIALRGLRGVQGSSTPARSVLAIGESSRLPHAAREAELVAGLFAALSAGTLANNQACTGAQATLANVQHHAAAADVLHLACHAQFRADNPMFSALHLLDGPLTVERAQALPLRHGLVVLSACETGRAELASGDEALGLVRAFLVAGAARVVATLWPVDDAVTATFMAAFYTALLEGEERNTAAAALRAARSVVVQTHPHPFYWAAFTLYAGW